MNAYERSYPLRCPTKMGITLIGRKSMPLEAMSETLSRKFDLSELTQVFILPWSAYVRLLSVKDDHARQFYETEALRGGWSVRQLDRQIGSQFYEHTALYKDKVAMLVKGSVTKPRMPSRRMTRSKTHMCWSSSTSRTSTRSPILKRL